MAKQSSIYGLYQWEGTDPVSRVEMNHNFEVLEQHLKDKLTFLPLRTFTNPAAAQTVSLDMTGIDWDQYHEVVVELWYDSANTRSAEIYANGDQSMADTTYGSVAFGSVNPDDYRLYNNGLGKITGFRGRIKFLSNQHSQANVATECRSLNNAVGYIGWDTKITLSALSTLDFYCYSNVPAGVVFTVWGVK